MDQKTFVKDKLKQRNYKYQLEAKRDILQVLTVYKELFPEETEHVNKETSKQTTILGLSGSISVGDNGSTYNIPIQIQMLHKHPHEAPLVYVKPTGTMGIKPSQYVDGSGRVYIPLLTEWQSKKPKPKLTELVENVMKSFTQVLPVYIKKSPVDWDDAVENKLKANEYKYQSETKRDIICVLRAHEKLRPEEIVYVDVKTGKQTTILCLTGLIHVTYKYSLYQIPIQIEILPAYPQVAPIVYVKPTNTMDINCSRNVDEKGKVHLPLLAAWQNGKTKTDQNLIELVKQLQMGFGQDLPLHAKCDQTLEQNRQNARTSETNSTLFPTAYPTVYPTSHVLQQQNLINSRNIPNQQTNNTSRTVAGTIPSTHSPPRSGSVEERSPQFSPVYPTTTSINWYATGTSQTVSHQGSLSLPCLQTSTPPVCTRPKSHSVGGKPPVHDTLERRSTTPCLTTRVDIVNKEELKPNLPSVGTKSSTGHDTLQRRSTAPYSTTTTMQCLLEEESKANSYSFGTKSSSGHGCLERSTTPCSTAMMGSVLEEQIVQMLLLTTAHEKLKEEQMQNIKAQSEASLVGQMGKEQMQNMKVHSDASLVGQTGKGGDALQNVHDDDNALTKHDF